MTLSTVREMSYEEFVSWIAYIDLKNKEREKAFKAASKPSRGGGGTMGRRQRRELAALE